MSARNPRSENEVTLSIGALSRATGVPANTIRTWERRYGFPTPERSETGRREYAASLVPILRMVSLALEQGHPPRHVMGLDLETLRQLVGMSDETLPPLSSRPGADRAEDWLEATARMDMDALDVGFTEALLRLGLERFIQERAAPFLVALGHAWGEGRIHPYQEHHASARLTEFLAAAWRPLALKARGPAVVCAALPGEQHYLGLHFVASILALNGIRVVFLGPDTPVADIAACVTQCGARAVSISVSSAAPTESSRAQLQQLRGLLSSSVTVLVGGAGAPADVLGVRRLDGLDDLGAWAEGFKYEDG